MAQVYSAELHTASNSGDDGKGQDGRLENLNRYATNGSVAIPREVFEMIYLSPQKRVKGHLRQTFGNPTPLALLGFLVATNALGCAQLGWRGAGGGSATIGVAYYFGGALQILGSVMEWIIGNTFPCVVFGCYGAFWLAYGATLQPAYNAEGAYTAGKTGTEAAAGAAQFQSSFAFYLIFLAIVTLMFLVCSLRTNIIFTIMFFLLDIAICLLAASNWVSAEGRTKLGDDLEKGTGGCLFTLCMFGWYLLFAQLLQALDFPFVLPVGDLSTKINGASDSEAGMAR